MRQRETPERLRFDRGRWLADAFDSTGDADIVFFDPDNGIESKSIRPGNMHEYVLWSEIDRLHRRGQSLAIYRHFGHRGTMRRRSGRC